MILRLSQKLAKKIKVTPTRVLPLNPNAFADWSAHLFTADRTQFAILTNTASLYSALMFARGISTDSLFLDRGLSCIREVMIEDGLQFIYARFVAPSTRSIEFSKSLSRSVTGSMNDLVQCARVWLTEGDLSPHDTSFKLNEMPMSALRYANPREAMRSVQNSPTGIHGSVDDAC